MKKVFWVFLIVCATTSYAQQMVINDKLLEQLTKNQGVRVASAFAQQSAFKKSKESYDKANQNVIQILAVKQKLFDAMTNIENGFENGKQIKYIVETLLPATLNELQTLMKQLPTSPDVLLLRQKYVNEYKEQIVLASTEIYETVLKVNKDYLIDHYQRQKLLDDIQNRVFHIYNMTAGFNRMMYFYSKSTWWKRVPKFELYVNQDKWMFENILNNSKNLFK